MQSHVFLALDPPWLEDRVCPCWDAPWLEEKKDTDTSAAPCPQHAALTPSEAPVGWDGSPPSSFSNYDRPRGARVKRGEGWVRTASGKGGQRKRGEREALKLSFCSGEKKQDVARRHKEWPLLTFPASLGLWTHKNPMAMPADGEGKIL